MLQDRGSHATAKSLIFESLTFVSLVFESLTFVSLTFASPIFESLTFASPIFVSLMLRLKAKNVRYRNMINRKVRTSSKGQA